MMRVIQSFANLISMLCILQIPDVGSVDISALHISETNSRNINSAVEATVYYLNQQKTLNMNITVRRIRVPINDLCETYNAMYGTTAPDIVLDTTNSKWGSEEFISKMGLPTVTTSFSLSSSWKKADPGGKFIIPIILPGANVAELMWEIISTKGLRNAVIIFLEGIGVSDSVRERMRRAQIHHVVMRYQSAMSQQLRFFESINFSNFFLLGRLWNQKNLQLDKRYTYYSITPNLASVYNHSEKNNGIVAYQDTRYNNPLYKYFKSTMDGFFFNVGVMTFSAARDFVSENAWSIRYPNCTQTNIYPTRKSVDLRKYLKESDMWIMGPMKNDGVNMYMSFNVTLALNSDIVATWTAGYNSTIKIVNKKIYEGYNPEIHYKVMVALKPPFVYFDFKSRKQYSGYLIDVLHVISSRLNFTYSITHLPYNKTWGDRSRSKNIIVSALENKNVDIGLGPIYISSEHETAVTFSISYYRPVGIRFLMKRFRDNSIFTFITVLDNVVWGCILFAFFTTSPKSYRNNKEKYKNDGDVRTFTFKECLWYCIMSLMPQGGGKVPKHLSGRLAAASWWLFGFIILASYTANLAAFLTISKMKNPIDTFDDLYKQFNLHYAPLNGSVEMMFFKNMAATEAYFRTVLTGMISNRAYTNFAPWEYSMSTKYTRMWESMQRTKFPLTTEEALRRIYDSSSTTEGFAFVADAIDVRYIDLTNCELVDVGEEISVKQFGIAFRKHTLLIEEFNRVLYDLKAEGYLQKLENKWWEKNPFLAKNCVKLEDQSLGIGILNIGGVFIIIVVGFICACIVMMHDFYMYRYRENYRVVVVKEITEARAGNRRPVGSITYNQQAANATVQNSHQRY